MDFLLYLHVQEKMESNCHILPNELGWVDNLLTQSIYPPPFYNLAHSNTANYGTLCSCMECAVLLFNHKKQTMNSMLNLH